MHFDANINRIVIENKDGYLYVNKYKIIEHVATGSFCKVYKVIAQDGNNSHIAAMITSKDINQIQNKVDIQKLLNNIDHVPKIYEYYIKPNVVYDKTDDSQQKIYEQVQYAVMFQQFLPYQPLTTKVFDNIPLDQHINKRIHLFLQLVQTILSIHECGVYHLDLKPENIIISNDDYYIIDFGSAQHVENDDDYQIMDTCVSQNQKATVVYNITPSYSSFKYDQSNGLLLCEKYDAYSLGCIFYYFMMNEHLHKPLSQQQDKCKQICDEYGYLIFDLILGLTNEDPVLRYSLKECIQHPTFYQFQLHENNKCWCRQMYKELEQIFNDQTNDYVFYALPMKIQIKLIYQFRLQHTFILRQEMQHNVKRCNLFKQRSKSVQKPQIKKKNNSYDDFDMKYYKDFIRYHEYNYPCNVLDEGIIKSSGSQNNILDWEQNCQNRNTNVNKIINSYRRYYQLFFWGHQFIRMYIQIQDQDDNYMQQLGKPLKDVNCHLNNSLFTICDIQLGPPCSNHLKKNSLQFDTSLLDSLLQDPSDEISEEYIDAGQVQAV